MAKAITAFYGYDTFGHQIEVAESVDGIWFYRRYSWNGWGVCWSKWDILEDGPTFKTKGINRYTGDTFSYEEGEAIQWGFSTLSKYERVPKFRLPKYEVATC